MAITLWQPYASLWAAGIKRNETRSWETEHRGQLAIHAAKLSALDLQRRIGEDAYIALNRLCLAHGLGYIPMLPRGCIVGTVEVVDCREIDRNVIGVPVTVNRLSSACCSVEIVSEFEQALGDYTPGRYAWIGVNHRTIEPIPWRGQQGLWTLPDEWEPAT